MIRFTPRFAIRLFLLWLPREDICRSIMSFQEVIWLFFCFAPPPQLHGLSPGIAVHGIGHEVATPELQRWGHVNEDILVEHDMISSKSDASIWRTAVAARPIRGHAYVDFTIDRNPKPETRSIQIGVVPKSDLNGVEKPGVNFINFQVLLLVL